MYVAGPKVYLEDDILHEWPKTRNVVETLMEKRDFVGESWQGIVFFLRKGTVADNGSHVDVALSRKRHKIECK